MDRITQSEIKAFVNAKDAIDETEQAIMLRMAAGAEIEPGELALRSEYRSGEDIEHCSLEIETAEEAAEFDALVAQGKAERAALATA